MDPILPNHIENDIQTKRMLVEKCLRQWQRQHKSGAVGDGVIEIQVSVHLAGKAPAYRQADSDAGSRVRGVGRRFGKRHEEFPAKV